MPRGSAVIPYHGKRGTVWRIKYADAEGKQVMETLGAGARRLERKRRPRPSCASGSSASSGRATGDPSA